MKPIFPEPSTISRKLFGGSLIGDPDFPVEGAGKTGQRHLHLHAVLVVADFFEAFAARHGARQDVGSCIIGTLVLRAARV